jgi:histone deacetylase 1/2
MTRPYLSYAVNQVCQYMHSPIIVHFEAVKRISHYLKGIVGYGITFLLVSSFSLNVFFDSDWAGLLHNHCLTTTGCLFLGLNLIWWCSKKQLIISRSTIEIEYRALIVTINLYWIQSLICDLSMFLANTPILFRDNISTTYLVLNPILHTHTKHIEVDYHFIWEHKTHKELFMFNLLEVTIDGFTKVLSSSRFLRFWNKLNTSLYRLSMREGVRNITPTYVVNKIVPIIEIFKQGKEHLMIPL